jgi:hypothetical protein
MTELELRQHCKNTFSTGSGKIMLLEIMKQASFLNCGRGEITKDMPELLGKHNLVNWILALLGCSDNPEMNFMAIIEGLGDLPIKSKPDKQKEEE